MTRATMVLDAKAGLGECPRWHAGEARLYWVDIARCEFHRFDPATGRDECRAFAPPTGCFAFRRGGGLVLGMKDGLAILEDWDAEPVPFGDQILAGKPDLRLNDGRTDAEGRFWAGSVNMVKSSRNAALYRFDQQGRVALVENDMMTCNGAAFSADGSLFMHTDTPSHALRLYDADGQHGTIANCRLFHAFPQGRGRPDGGSFDEAGHYWSALYEGGCVVRLAPDGEIVEMVTLPVPRPTMIAFGGPGRRTAYVTTARAGMDKAGLAAAPLSGAIFSFTVDTPGVAEWEFG
jgi:sugar lactone lactonase YvrE